MESLKFIAPRSEEFVDWTEAYARVENFFCSLRVENKLLLSQLVARVLKRASEKLERKPGQSPAVLAMLEADREVERWFADVLEAAGVEPGNVRAKGRLALFLADMPRKWQKEFLQQGPWPTDFLEAMKATYLNTGPDFQRSRMYPREIDLGPVSAVADETWRALDRWPFLGAILVWAVYLGAIGAVVYLVR